MALAMTACADSDAEEHAGQQAPREAATYAPTEDGGDDSLMKGTLREESGCLVVEVEGRGATVPVFPENRVAAAQDALLQFDGELYAGGDTIELGGGGSGVPIEELDFAQGPEACERLDTFIVHPSS